MPNSGMRPLIASQTADIQCWHIKVSWPGFSLSWKRVKLLYPSLQSECGTTSELTGGPIGVLNSGIRPPNCVSDRRHSVQAHQSKLAWLQFVLQKGQIALPELAIGMLPNFGALWLPIGVQYSGMRPLIASQTADIQCWHIKVSWPGFSLSWKRVKLLYPSLQSECYRTLERTGGPIGVPNSGMRPLIACRHGDIQCWHIKVSWPGFSLSWKRVKLLHPSLQSECYRTLERTVYQGVCQTRE